MGDHALLRTGRPALAFVDESASPPSGADVTDVPTVFSFGYKGYGSGTARFVKAVDDVERARGFEPPLWVDVRISRKVRALGFRERAFERRVGPGRYLWLRDLGNEKVLDHSGGVKIRNPDAVAELLAAALATRRRRVIFFCSCSGNPLPDREILDCRAIVSGYAGGPSIEHGLNRACYSPIADRVSMPAASAFESSEAYYATLLHELVHSSGHPSRLGRFPVSGVVPPFGSADYSREELVAEMGAALLCAEGGISCATIENQHNHASIRSSLPRPERRHRLTSVSRPAHPPRPAPFDRGDQIR